MENEERREDDLLSSDVCREELEHFKRRRPEFGNALARLQSALQQAFCRELQVAPEKGAIQGVVFGLGHQAVVDFFDVVLLATHGYGIGAQKLLRPLFERVVSALYLIKYPDDVQDFNDYIDIDAWRAITKAEGSGVDVVGFMGKEQFEVAEKAFGDAAARFTRPGATRVRPSWARKDLAERADAVGLGKLYGACAFWPTMLLHTTGLSLEARLTTTPIGTRAFTHAPTREEADAALKSAHDLITFLLHGCNQFFGWGLNVGPFQQDVMRCWASEPGGQR